MFMAIRNAQEIFAKGRSELVADKNLSLPARHPFHFTPATPECGSHKHFHPQAHALYVRLTHCLKAVQWPPGEASALELAGIITPPARVSHCPPASSDICKVWSGAIGGWNPSSSPHFRISEAQEHLHCQVPTGRLVRGQAISEKGSKCTPGQTETGPI